MNISLSNIKTPLRALSAVILMAVALAAQAFAPDFYTSQSVLANCRWVKIAVEESGLHMIPVATLRSWGFSDPSRVRIYGYGGRMIPEELSAANYIDDLPQAASELTSTGLVFYAAGPDSWVKSIGNNFHREPSIYTTAGYYFLTESDTEPVPMPVTGVGTGADCATTAQARLHYEVESTLMSEAGTLMVGDDLRARPSRSYNFATPGRVAGSEVWVETQVVHNHLGNSATITQTVDGTTFTDAVPATTDSHYVHGSLVCARRTFNPADASRFTLDLEYAAKRSVYTAYLDYISVNYTRLLKMDSPEVASFWSSSPRIAFAGPEELRVWDVTNPAAVERVGAQYSAGTHSWSVSRGGTREYVAWVPGAAMPTPTLVGTVANQNLHAADTCPDIIIFSPAAYKSQALRLAQLHASTDGLEAEVIDPAEVYNEFSSGAADVSGLRKYLKMRYDRSTAAGHPLRYVILMGRATLDNRAILASTRNKGNHTLPAWGATTAKQALSDNDGFLTDDFLAMLGDGAGVDMGLDNLTVAVGRIPMLTPAEGDALIDKLEIYLRRSPATGWKNRVLILADDEDQGEHLRQAEAMVANMEATPGQQHIFNKVYIDAYERSNGTVPEARRLMFDALDEGVALWVFTGHANNHSWTGEAMLTFTDINSMYLRHLPMVVAATCDFLRWDSETISGGEIMYKEPNGGAIAMVSATRPVYISENAHFLSAFGRHALERDAEGRLYTAGDAYRRTKNDIRDSSGQRRSNPNRLRFVFMGDPAMPLATPHNVVEITAINGIAPGLDTQPTLAAMQNATVEGRVTAPDGTPLTDFNGMVTLDIYDALRSITTLANGNGKEEIFDAMGDKLFAGSAAVTDGRFSARVAMPSMVADNFREATMSLYARDTATGAEAVGANRGFYVYGYEEPESPDTEAPVIDSIVLNHDGFENGATVASSPMLIAHVSDNVGLNLSNMALGHRMTITLDELTTYSDVATYYTPDTDGRQAGTVRYPLQSLTDGAHTLRLRVFDTSGNFAESHLDFNVDDSMAPCVFEVYTDVNPAHTAANFYVRHDRPDNIMEVSVGVYDLMGRPVWSSTVKGLSDMNVSPPVTWDLCDGAGRRVPRGIYLYRATVTTTGGQQTTASRRIAVAAK